MNLYEVSKYRDPLRVLLDYIAEVRSCILPLPRIHIDLNVITAQRAPDCDMFLIHDDDLQTIDGIGDDTVSGIFEYHFYCSLHVCSYWKPSSQTWLLISSGGLT